MLGRIERTQRWLGSADSELLLVTSPHDAEAGGARQLAQALRGEGLSARAVIVNRTWPADLSSELGSAQLPVGSERLVAYAKDQIAAQAATLSCAASLAKLRVIVPSQLGLETVLREALLQVGALLGQRLDPPTPVLPPGAERTWT
jgi:hypothetical protein